MLSIIHLAKLLNLYTRERLFFESFPIDENKCVIRFADQEDATLAKFKFDKSFQDMIFPWTGAIVDIPPDWVLCDGTHGTPDLRDRFIVGTSALYPVNDTGGTITHGHSLVGSGHFHTMPVGTDLAGGANRNKQNDTKEVSGTTDPTNHIPFYHALAFVQNKGWDV